MSIFKKKNRTRVEDDSKYILTEKSPWPVQEAYKALRTNLIFSLPENGCKVIAVSSAFQHDGKSINAINTAIAFGQLGKKVLIIESDLRLPTVGAKLQTSSIPGLSDFLVGREVLKNCIKPLKKYGVDLLPAGNIPPDPTWMLQSQRMKLMLDTLKKYYDYIIIDLPPVNSVADATIVSTQTDGVLLVVRDHVTDIRAVDAALQQLKMADARVLGFLYNDVIQENGKYYKHYGHYYK